MFPCWENAKKSFFCFALEDRQLEACSRLFTETAAVASYRILPRQLGKLQQWHAVSEELERARTTRPPNGVLGELSRVENPKVLKQQCFFLARTLEVWSFKKFGAVCSVLVAKTFVREGWLPQNQALEVVEIRILFGLLCLLMTGGQKVTKGNVSYLSFPWFAHVPFRGR